MKTIFHLVLNDLKRDGKHPWSMVLLAGLPLVLSILIAAIFGGQGSTAKMPVVHVAVLDQDRDFLTRLLRSLSGQGDAAQNLKLHFVQSRDEGLRLVEKNQVSAFLVLPTNLTVNLLRGQTNAVELYENPSQQVLPKVVRQGTSLLALGLSSTAELLGEPLWTIREMVRSNDFPAQSAIGEVAQATAGKLGGIRTYLFPPLVSMETVPAGEFHPLATHSPGKTPPP